MIAHQFMLRIEQPPTDEQVRRLFALTHDVCVEVGAFRRWAAVAGDRRAPLLAGAVVTTILDLDAAGLVPIDSGPDDDIVPIWLIAERLGSPEPVVRTWAEADKNPSAFPARVEMPGTTAYFRWNDVVSWLRSRLGFEPGDVTPVFSAVNMVMRLRTVLPRIDGEAAIRSLLGDEDEPQQGGDGQPRCG